MVAAGRVSGFSYSIWVFLQIFRMYNKISDIVAGKIEWKIKVRVLHLWETKDYKKPQITNSIDLLLIDEQNSKIHATIKRGQMNQFKDMLSEGKVYMIQNFMVQASDKKFRVTKHKYKISFLVNTKIEEATCDTIPSTKFDFVSFSEIQTAADDHYLIDVIGHIVQKDELKENEKDGKKNKHIDVGLQDLEGNNLVCTLWGSYADKIVAYLGNESDDEAPVLNRYKVNVSAIDDSGSASLVLFDGSLLPFIGKNAEELQAAMDEAAHGQGYPIELNSMIGEFFMLNIDVTQKNIEDNWQTYTVKKLSHDQAIISKYRLKHNIEDVQNKNCDATQSAHGDQGTPSQQPYDLSKSK